jgi:hypothetical protein
MPLDGLDWSVSTDEITTLLSIDLIVITLSFCFFHIYGEAENSRLQGTTFKVTSFKMRKIWWKILCVVIIFYVIMMGFMGPVPRLAIINESIRNTYFHVALWLAMTLCCCLSMVFSVRYLNKGNIKDDDIASEVAKSAIFFGILGCLTGSVWANYTWGDPWPNDPETEWRGRRHPHLPGLFAPQKLLRRRAAKSTDFIGLQHFRIRRFHPDHLHSSPSHRLVTSGQRRQQYIRVL